MKNVFLIGGLVGLLAGCVQGIPSGAGLYRDNCVACHGVNGAGTGAWSDQLARAPADLRFLSAANDGVFPTQDVITKVYGYRGRNFDALMPEFGSALAGPSVRWALSDGTLIETSAPLRDLVMYLETLQR